MIGDNLLEKISKGDPEAVAHFKDILRIDGVIGPQEVFPLQLAAVSAALAQTGKGKGSADLKLDIFSDIFERLSSIHADDLISGPADFRSRAEKLSAESPEDVAKVWRYDKLMMLALVGPQGDREGLKAGRERLLEYLEDGLYSPVIQVGLMLAEAARGESRLEPGVADLANRCLVNAARYGRADASMYAMEAIGIAGNEEAKTAAVNRLIDMVESGGSEQKQQALETLLRHFSEDAFAKVVIHELALENAEIRSILSGMARGADRKLSKVAGNMMADVRTENEVEWMKADRETVLIDYPEYSPQRLYLECMYQAIGTVMGRYPSTPKERTEYEVALLQLATAGNPGQIEALFDSKGDRLNLSKMIKDVENALLSALSNGYSPEVRQRAAQGLEKIGSQRIEDILERIAQRHGEDTEAGALASETLSRIRGKSIMETAIEVETFRRPPVPRPARKMAAPALKIPQ